MVTGNKGRRKKLEIEWKDNMLIKKEPRILNTKTDNFTEITF